MLISVTRVAKQKSETKLQSTIKEGEVADRGISDVKSDINTQCPVCLKEFPQAEVERHADLCCELSTSVKEPTPSMTSPRSKAAEALLELSDGNRKWRQALETKRAAAINFQKKWNISVIRTDVSTLMDELTLATEENWGKLLRVQFLGEAGLDLGGLTKEFLTTLFKKTHLLNGRCFTVSSSALSACEYKTLGRAVSYGLLLGHPGPKCLDPIFSKYILQKKIPDLTHLPVYDLAKSDVINQVHIATDEESLRRVWTENLEVFESAGCTRELKISNKEEVVKELSEYYGFYHYMGVMQQFSEGLELHGVLDLMALYKVDALHVLSPLLTTAQEVVEYLRVVHSPDNSNLKAKEVRIVYHFFRFLKESERKMITSEVLDPNTGCSETTIIDVELICGCLFGCQGLPLDKDYGQVKFEHGESGLPTFNTCLPLVTFKTVGLPENYALFKDIMILAIVGSKEYFGRA